MEKATKILPTGIEVYKYYLTTALFDQDWS